MNYVFFFPMDFQAVTSATPSECVMWLCGRNLGRQTGAVAFFNFPARDETAAVPFLQGHLPRPLLGRGRYSLMTWPNGTLHARGENLDFRARSSRGVERCTAAGRLAPWHASHNPGTRIWQTTHRGGIPAFPAFPTPTGSTVFFFRKPRRRGTAGRCEPLHTPPR